MGQTVVPIGVGGIVTQHNRNDQINFDVNSWFKDERLVITFGDYVGRPSDSYVMREEYLSMFLQNGWKLEENVKSTEGGKWSKTTTSHVEAESSGDETSESHATTSTGSRTETESDSKTETVTDSTVTEEGDPYWYTSKSITLVRRRMQPDLVLSSISSMFTSSYNNGVHNEDARFNELVTLYGIMLNRNETEGNRIVNDALDVTGLFDDYRLHILHSQSRSYWSAKDTISAASAGAESEIRQKYDALISRSRSEMIGNGTYNGTVWPTVEAGLIRQMSSAIAEAKTKSMATATDTMRKVLDSEGDVMKKLVDAKNEIAAAIDQRKITAIDLRNTVLQSMINFIGSREDVYPQLQEISNTASQIGFSVGASGTFG